MLSVEPYRRQLLLALLQEMNWESEDFHFQKTLSLLCARQPIPSYHFVKTSQYFGSFVLRGDKAALIQQGYLQNEINWSVNTKVRNIDFLSALGAPDRELVKKLARQKSRLFTIGYEGKSLDEFINLLLREDVRVLVDVRRHPWSLKFGFTREELEATLQVVGIGYVHLPGLGIASEDRRKVGVELTREELFSTYARDIQNMQKDDMSRILHLLEERKLVALTCFEAEPEHCHRSHVARVLAEDPHFNADVLDL